DCVQPLRSAAVEIDRHQGAGRIDPKSGRDLAERLTEVHGPDVERDVARHSGRAQPVLDRPSTLAWRQLDQLDLDPRSRSVRVEISRSVPGEDGRSDEKDGQRRANPLEN